jgi:hypothetical protein
MIGTQNILLYIKRLTEFSILILMTRKGSVGGAVRYDFIYHKMIVNSMNGED